MSDQTKILVVDDDLTNLEILTERLEDENFHVLEAASGEAALEILNDANHGVSLVILDWMMPGISGLEVLTQIKQNHKLKDIPVIMQTAKAYSEDMVTGIESGACQYITKPFSKKVLISLVYSTLDQFNKFENIESEMEKQKEFMKGCATRMMKRQEEMRFDLKTYQAFNEFFLSSLHCKSHDELAKILLNIIKKFSFSSAGETREDKMLRCSLRLTGEKEIDISDRGIFSSMDKIILQKASDKKQIIQNGAYTAIPSRSGRNAALIRNTPKDNNEAEKAIEIISIFLERFEERLIHLENEADIVSQNSDLLKKSNQIHRVVYSCRKELRNVNETYQDMKTKQMHLLEGMAEAIFSQCPGLENAQKENIKEAVGKELLKSMDLYSADQITDQKFQLTIQRLSDLMTGKTTDLTPSKTISESSQLGNTSQDEVDNLMALLG